MTEGEYIVTGVTPAVRRALRAVATRKTWSRAAKADVTTHEALLLNTANVVSISNTEAEEAPSLHITLELAIDILSEGVTIDPFITIYADGRNWPIEFRPGGSIRVHRNTVSFDLLTRVRDRSRSIVEGRVFGSRTAQRVPNLSPSEVVRLREAVDADLWQTEYITRSETVTGVVVAHNRVLPYTNNENYEQILRDWVGIHPVYDISFADAILFLPDVEMLVGRHRVVFDNHGRVQLGCCYISSAELETIYRRAAEHAELGSN